MNYNGIFPLLIYCSNLLLILEYYFGKSYLSQIAFCEMFHNLFIEHDMVWSFNNW